MTIAMYLKPEGVEGESKDSAHTGWIDILSFNWGANQPNNMSVGGGGGAGKVNYQDLHVHARIDKATPTLMLFCSNGKHIPTLEFHVCKAGGSQIIYNKINLTEVLVTSVQFTGSRDDDTVGIEYSFQAAQVEEIYTQQSDDGAAGADSTFGWNIKTNTAS
ncbi:type VI secretion system tube protein Hcp [Pantoea sp.]|uniref:Hcp family type VI secretion system effector n=1 Tax=Pantoea sp. TaxID=69393 RepID=UPI0031D55667